MGRHERNTLLKALSHESEQQRSSGSYEYRQEPRGQPNNDWRRAGVYTVTPLIRRDSKCGRDDRNANYDFKDATADLSH